MLLRGILKVRIELFFSITAFVLMGFASGLLSNGFNDWSQAEFFGPWKTSWGADLAPEQRRWTTQPLWSTLSIANNSNFFNIFGVLFGYNSSPTFITIMCYTLYWIVALAVLQAMSERAGAIKPSTVGTYISFMRIESGLTLFWYFLTFIWACVVSQHPYPAFMISIIGSICHICSYIATSRAPSLKDATKRLAAIVGFWLWTWISLYTVIFILVQLHCAGKNLCGTFGTDYFYAFFIFSRSYNTGPRLHDSWRTGAVLTMALVFHLFHGYFHGLFMFYTMRQLSSTPKVSTAKPAADSSSPSECSPPSYSPPLTPSVSKYTSKA